MYSTLTKLLKWVGDSQACPHPAWQYRKFHSRLTEEQRCPVPEVQWLCLHIQPDTLEQELHTELVGNTCHVHCSLTGFNSLCLWVLTLLMAIRDKNNPPLVNSQHAYYVDVEMETTQVISMKMFTSSKLNAANTHMYICTYVASSGLSTFCCL